MYPLAVIGDDATARAAILACQKAGFDDITWLGNQSRRDVLPAITLGANLTRIVHALGGGEALRAHGHIPDREQVRIAASTFLLSELPLGDFTADRYGAPHVNIEDDAWPSILPIAADPEINSGTEEAVKRFERNTGVTIVCDDPTATTRAAATHTLWHAKLPYDEAQAKANITWLARQQIGWQFSTPRHLHFYFCTPIHSSLEAAQWHPQLHAAIDAAAPRSTFRVSADNVRAHWQEGGVAYAGSACYASSPFLREATALGLEDAWVLSRMLENYEQDVHDGLHEYERYRRPRAIRVAAACATATQRALIPSGISSWLRNANIAFSARFVPEIAMQRIDWLYQYDCVKGFT